MNKRNTTAIICAVALALAALVGVSAYLNRSASELQPQEQSLTAQQAAAYSTELSDLLLTQTQDAPDVSTLPQSTQKEEADTAQSTLPDGTTTLTTLLSTVKQTVSEVVTTVKSSLSTASNISSYFVMPKAPKYISKYPNIDFDSVNLASYKYNATGNYYYTDDKDCWQDNFGYNQVYDKLAVVGHMYYDTVRVCFDYGNEHWLIQLWKGQYGYVFVGSEIGVYTRAWDSKTNSYACADKEDWLYMEMTCFWDSAVNGNYEAVLTRPYDKYWWCTGFVLGWLNNTRDCEEVEMVGRITFKDKAMADAFSSAFISKGFTKRSSYDYNSKDSFIQVGKDVAFVWKSLSE